MLGFVGCVVKAAVFRRVFILLVVLHSVICNDSLNGLLSSPSKVKSEKCTLATTPCVPIAQHLNRTCLGNHLPYKLTASIPLDEDVTFYSLKFWSALQSIPSCWDKLQFFLCSVYIPECVIIPTSKTTESNQSYSNNYSVSVTNYQESNRDYLPVNNSPSSSSPSFINVYRVVLPEAEMCEAVHKACPLLFSLVYSLNGINNINNAGTSHINSSNNNNRDDITTSKHSYPKFLDCSLYTPGCRQNKLTARLFQSNGGGCQSPLVTTSLRRNCYYTISTEQDKRRSSESNKIFSGIFTIRLQLAERLEITLQLSAYIHRLIDSLHLPTFSTDRKSHLIYRGKSQLSPSSVVAGTETKATTSSNDAIHNNNNINNPSWYLLHTSLFYIHLFLIFGCFGWLLPLLPNIGEYVACREDGSLRIGEPQISSGKSVLCIVDFILLYFSSMAAAIWSNIFDYALLYQIKKINFNLSNPQHHQYPSQHHHHHRHHHHHHHGRQEQHHRYADLEMKHFQSRVTKSSGNSSKKHNKSSECFTTMQKRISDEPLSEITNSINLTNEKSSEFEICNEEHLIAVNDTAFNAANNNTADITIQPSISKDCRNKNNNKSECKSKKPHLSEFSSSSASSAPSSPPSMTSSSSLLLLSTQNVDNTKMKECIHLSNILTTTTATVTKSHNPENELQTKQGRDLTSDHRKLHSSPSHHHDLVCLESILQHSPMVECVCLNPHHNHNHSRRHYHHPTSSQNYRQYKCGSFTSIPLDSLIDLLSYDCLNSCIYPSPCFPILKPLISQILWIQLFSDDKYLFIHNVDTIGTAVNDDNYKRDHDNAEVVDDVDIDNDDALDGHSLNTMSNFYVTNHTANTTIPAATTCSHMKSLMLKHGVIISSSMHNQTINTQPQTTCLHLLALAIPLVFTLIILTAAEIDGNSLSGICSVGLINIWARVGLLLIPITLCLVIKFYYFIQLILQFMKLRHKFLLSSFRVDHKIAQRLVRYSLFYIIFLIFLLGLWLFSICIHTYIYLNEPVWLESQRLLFLCRIRYRLLGLDELAAVNVCVGAASSYESDDTLLSASAFNIHSRHMPLGGNSFFMNGVSIDSHHSSQSVSDLLLIKSSDLQHQQYQKQQRASQSVQQTNNNEGKTTRISTYLPIEEMSVRKPSVGPVLLHLLLYFAINLLYNSMILLDPSVKRSWWYLLKRVIFWCQWKKQKFSQSLRQQQHHVRAQQYTRRRDSHQNPHHLYVDNVADDYDGNYNGEINLGIKDKTDYLIKSYLNNITIGFSWWDPGFFTIPTPILSSNDLWIKWNTLLYSNEEHMKQLMRKQNIVASSLLSSKQDSELVQCKSSLPAGNNNSVNNTTLLNNCTNIHDADADNENTGNRCNITDFHVTPDQFNCVMNSLETLLLVATPNDLLECPQHLSTLLSKLILSSNTDCLKQSFLDQQHSQLPSTSSSALTNNISNNNLESALFILRQLYQLSSSTNMATLTAAVAYEHYQKQLSDLTTNIMRRRSRHKRLLSGRSSTFGGSQISSTSIRSALTSVGISNRHRHHRRRKNNHTRPSSTSEALLTNNINNNISTENELKPNIDDSIGVSSAKHSSTAANNNNNIHNMGSRISSLRSISCASSSGAESYNSYRLLINQAGASWRELWRTRMLLMHVLRWAENVAPFMQSNNSTNSSNNVNSNVIHNECSKSQISLLNCFDTSTNNNSVDCVKTTLITSTSVTNTPTTVPACNCNDNRSNTFSVGHQLPIFNPISSKIDETSDFNAQLVQLIISLIEKQRQPVDSRTESQSKLDIESQLPTNLLGTKCADEQASQYPTNSDTTITNSSGINYTENHFIGQTYPLTSIDPMMAAAFAAATAAATVALQQQHQRQNQQAFRQSSSFNSTSPADGGVITSGKPTTINNNYINQFNPSVGISSNNVINNQFCNDLYPFMTQWTSGSGSLGPLPQDVLHSSTSLSNNLSHFVTKNTSPYSQDDYLSPGVLSSTFSHHRPPPYNSNSLRFHAPYSNGHNNNNNQSSSTHCINTEGSYHHHLMPSNSGYATNISDNHHQCTAAPDLLIDHNQLSTGSRDKYINNPSSCSRLFTGGQQQSQPQQLPVNPLFGCFHHSVNSTVTPSTDILQVPSSASNSQQNKQANASTNPFNILPRSSFYTEPNSTDTILISSQNTGFEPNVNLLLANSFSKTAVQGDDLSVNNDSDAFNSEDEIISVNDEDNVIEMDKSLCPNESVESDIKQQRKQLLTYTPNQFNTYEQHMIASITNPNTYFMPNFINSNLHHLTAIESTIVTTTLTSMTTYPHSSHPLSPYSNMIMQTKRNIYNVSPDDGEMSSVSQSASQIVPCESSQSSSSSCTDSSSSSPSKLLPKLNPYELNHIVTDSLYSSTGHQKHTTNAEDNHTDDVPALTTLLPSDKNQSSSHDDINDVKIVDETIKSTM
ncbi:Smoothened like [Schistosoma japonicum]|nr:Smoothened like [Schistosoma japonicum]